ncbi:hypothetical protein V6U90_32980 [Micromonospora sp. CPCC 206060]|uniref:hypothetical protein n=1 Tax=Micromonospora sp. CPCC 206060 TaxID=3122406 RepID=UPI002FF0C418
MTAPAINGTPYARFGRLFIPADSVPTSPDAPTPVVADPIPPAVPVDQPAKVDPVPAESTPTAGQQLGPVTADEIRAKLAAGRDLVDAKRDDALARRRQEVEHRIALAEVEDLEADQQRSRRERAEETRESAKLTRYYRRAAGRGARARIRADIDRSVEMRTLRVARVRAATLAIGIPALLAFGAWSTAGVQAGVARLLGLNDGSAGWWAAWGVEPALLAVVALIIISRAVLESSGGSTDQRATRVEWTALLTSIALNMAGGWHGQGWSAAGGLIAHSIGPVGAAGVAYLIGLLLGYVAAARPWHDAPRLADLDLPMPTTGPVSAADSEAPPEVVNLRKLPTPPNAPETSPEAVGGLSETDRDLLHRVLMAIESRALGTAPSGWQIYQQVMNGRGDKARAYRVADIVRTWRPGQPAPLNAAA